MNLMKTSNEDLSYEELATSYKEPCVRSAELCQLGEDQKKVITKLQAERLKHLTVISGLKDEVVLLNSKLDNMTKSVRMLNSSSDVLDEILQIGKNAGDVKGLGYDNQVVMKKGKMPAMKFVQPKRKQEQKMSGQMSQHQKRHQNDCSGSKTQRWRCHYCGRFGHIKPFCYRLYGYPK